MEAHVTSASHDMPCQVWIRFTVTFHLDACVLQDSQGSTMAVSILESDIIDNTLCSTLCRLRLVVAYTIYSFCITDGVHCRNSCTLGLVVAYTMHFLPIIKLDRTIFS
jgi:hypothetical protein